MVIHKASQVKLILLTVILGTLFCVQTPTASADTLAQINSYFTPGNTATSTYYIQQVPEAEQGDSWSYGIVRTELVTYYGYATTSNICVNLGNSSTQTGLIFASTTITKAGHDAILGGYADCSNSGTYYVYLRNNTQGKIYYSSYYYDEPTESWYVNSSYAECTTCSRVIAVDPAISEVISATSTSYSASVDVYVADADFNDGDTYLRWTVDHSTTKFSGDDSLNTTGIIPISRSDNLDTYNFSFPLTATGTYSMNYELYTDTWYSFEHNIIPPEYFNFYAVISSTLEEYQTALEEKVDNNPINIAQEFAKRVSLAPPFGYATIIYYKLLEATTTASTSVLSIDFTVPTGMPGAGKGITLNTGEALQDATTYLNNVNVPVFGTGSFDRFMYWWNLLWYLMLALWIIKEIYDIVGIDYNREHRSIWRDADNRSFEGGKVTKSYSRKEGGIRTTVTRSRWSKNKRL